MFSGWVRGGPEKTKEDPSARLSEQTRGERGQTSSQSSGWLVPSAAARLKVFQLSPNSGFVCERRLSVRSSRGPDCRRSRWFHRVPPEFNVHISKCRFVWLNNDCVIVFLNTVLQIKLTFSNFCSKYIFKKKIYLFPSLFRSSNIF